MDLKTVFTVFSLIFLAELGDKTQLAVLAMSAETKSPLSVFLGSSVALALTSLIAVVLGCTLVKFIPMSYVRTGTGLLFIFMGILLLINRL